MALMMTCKILALLQIYEKKSIIFNAKLANSAINCHKLSGNYFKIEYK
jgi:hypothetical protein